MKRKTKYRIGWIILLTSITGNVLYYTGVVQNMITILLASTPILLLMIIGGIILIWKNELTPEQKKEYKQKYKK